MSIRITTLNHKTPAGIKPWRYQVTFPRIEGHEVDMENLQPTLDLVKQLEEIRKAVVALFPSEPEDLDLTQAFTDIIYCLEGEIEEPGVYDDDDHLTGEIDYSLQRIYDYCDYYRVLLSPTKL